MKKYLLIIGFTLIWLLSFLHTSLASANIFWWNNQKIPYCTWNECWLQQWVEQVKSSGIMWIITEWTASWYIQRVVIYILWFLSIIAVILIIYAWFNMLTSAWDDEKAKKSKTIIIYSIIWLVIIFLAWPITTFVIWVLTNPN